MKRFAKPSMKYNKLRDIRSKRAHLHMLNVIKKKRKRKLISDTMFHHFEALPFDPIFLYQWPTEVGIRNISVSYCGGNSL